MKKSLLAFLLALSTVGQLPAAEEPEVVPVVIIGSGVGALTSAIYLGRAGIKHLVIAGKEQGGALAKSPSVQNWPGEVEISGVELTDKMHAQAEKNGTVFLAEEVYEVDFLKRPFTIKTRELFDKSATHTFKAETCIIGMGSTPNYLGVKGEQTYLNHGVYTCALCDGPLYKGKTVAIVGGGDAAITEANYLSRIAKEVHLVVRKDQFRASEEKRKNEVLSTPNIHVHFNSTIEEIKGDDNNVTELLVKEKGKGMSKLPVDALFLAIGSSPNTKLFTKQVELSKAGFVALKKGQETSVPGVFAVGDVVDDVCKQAICAAGHGALSTIQIENYLTTKTPVTAEKKTSHGSNKVIEITSEKQFQDLLKEGSLPLYVDFYAPWCGPCKMLQPKFEESAKKALGKAVYAKINVDVQSALAAKYNIKSLPTLLVFNKDGAVIERKVGADAIHESLGRK